MAALVWNYDCTCAFAEQQLTAAWGGGGGEGGERLWIAVYEWGVYGE